MNKKFLDLDESFPNSYHQKMLKSPETQRPVTSE